MNGMIYDICTVDVACSTDVLSESQGSCLLVNYGVQRTSLEKSAEYSSTQALIHTLPTKSSTASQSQPNSSIRNINPEQALQPPPIKRPRSTKTRYQSSIHNWLNALTQYLIPVNVTSALRSTYLWLSISIHGFTFRVFVAGIVSGEDGD